jgi:hypothetical protein
MNLGRVNFRPRVDMTLHQRLALVAEQAGVDWYDAVAAINAELERVCNVAAHAALVNMADSWTPQQWQAAAEIYGSHNQCSDEQGDGGASAPRDSLGLAR